MTDEELNDAWATLAPTPSQLRRVDARLFAWLDAHDTSIAAEWLGLFQVTPFPALGLVAASAMVIVVTTPLIWFARALAALV